MISYTQDVTNNHNCLSYVLIFIGALVLLSIVTFYYFQTNLLATVVISTVDSVVSEKVLKLVQPVIRGVQPSLQGSANTSTLYCLL